ncbi:hypothetical protein EDB89DRAFT_681832 [Lactarius sanguifluus]|nr:hypothetical protein EDB89DRAFT_681832 [Lactarius sanguifluus]
MVTPPRNTLDCFVDPDVRFIWNDNTGKRFLANRLDVGADADDGDFPNYDPNSDSARLQNIVRFFADIKDMLRHMNTQWWASDNAERIRRQLLRLFRARSAFGYHHSGGSMFNQRGDRASPAFVPAAQQDLITLTLEILARDPVNNVATSQHNAFRAAYEEFEWVAFTQAKRQAMEQRLGQPLAQVQVLSESGQEVLAWIDTQTSDSIGMVRRALGSVMQTNVSQSLSNSTTDGRLAPVPSPYNVGLPPSLMNRTSSHPDPGPSSSLLATDGLDIESGSP